MVMNVNAKPELQVMYGSSQMKAPAVAREG